MEYNTGVLTTKVGQFGVTEGEFTCLFMHLLTGIFGQDMWGIKVGAFLPSSVIKAAGDLHLEKLNLGSVVVYFFGILLIFICLYGVGKTLLTTNNKVQTVLEFIPYGILAGI